MIKNTMATIGPADDLGLEVDPVLKQLAETVGAELLHYRPPSPQASGGEIEEEARGGDYGEWWVFLRDPDGLLVTLDFPLDPTRVNWFVPTDEQPFQRPLSEAADMLDLGELFERSPPTVVKSCLLAQLNTRLLNVRNVRLDAWRYADLSRPDAHETRGRYPTSNADGIRLGELSIAGPQETGAHGLEALDSTARTWAEDVIATLGDAYSNEIPRWMWDEWRQPPSAPLRLATKIPLHLHVLLDDGSSWILPGLRRPVSRKSRCLSDRRVAFRRWLADVGGRPVAVLLIDPRMFAPQIFPSFGAQLHAETCEVRTNMAPNVEISWAACERRAETVGLVATSVRLT